MGRSGGRSGTEAGTQDGPRQGVGSVPPRVQDVLGVPALPPAGATSLTNRLRAGLARLGRRSAPPPVRILEAVLAPLDLAAVATLCRIGVPDHLHGRTAVDRLAADLDVDADRLHRLLRYAASRGWVRLDGRGRVAPTSTIDFLQREHPGGWRAWVDLLDSPEVTAAFGQLHVGLQPGGDPFAAATGAPFFAWLGDHPERHAAFDAAMAAGGQMHGVVLARAVDWSTSRCVCDVGGGTGGLLRALLATQPHLDGILFDLPEVVDRVTPSERMTTVGGDAFQEVPGACDTYLLVNVVHDWSDEEAVVLLRNVARSMAAWEGDAEVVPRVIVLEGEARARVRDDIAARSDLLMFALTAGGRERSSSELEALGVEAGLRRVRSVALASGDVAHVFVARADGGERRPRADGD